MSSEYCAQTNVEDVYGIENVKQWSDLDGTGETDTDRVARACDVASEQIDDFARVSNYKIPLGDEDGTKSDTVVNLAAILAGIWLYEARGSQDFNTATGDAFHRLEFLRIRAERLLDDIVNQRIRLNAVTG